MFDRYLVIEYQGQRSLVAVSERHPDRLYWFGGSSYMTAGPDVIVLHEYQVADFASEDAIEIEFWRRWRPVEPTRDLFSNGWIAPDGAFYRAAYMAHDSVARQIAAVTLGTLEGTKRLERDGWIRLDFGLALFADDAVPTQAQIDTVFDIHQVEIDPSIKRALERTLRRLQRIIEGAH